jgi:hypothetical protein
MTRLALKAKALAVYDAALSDPTADWRGVAEQLRGCLSSRKVVHQSEWADYPIDCLGRKIVWPSPVIQVDFADGERVRMSFACLPGKPVNIGRGMRVALGAYEMRTRTPSSACRVLRCHVEHNGKIIDTYPADEVNKRIGKDGACIRVPVAGITSASHGCLSYSHQDIHSDEKTLARYRSRGRQRHERCLRRRISQACIGGAGGGL